MIIQAIKGATIKDSRDNFTIEVTIDTNIGKFVSSAPNGKLKSKKETKPYKKSLEGDIGALEELSDYFSSEHIDKFEDLRRIEDITKGHIGANALFALESAALKAIAKENNIEAWEVINPESKKIPRLLGNCIGGGAHSENVNDKKPDFQEFLISPDNNSGIESWKISLESKKLAGHLLRQKDSYFRGGLNEENAWTTSLNEREILKELNKMNVPIGIDVAAAHFYKRKKYRYGNPKLDRTTEEQFIYIANIIKKLGIFYCEDPFYEDDFEIFSKLLKLVNDDCLIVGDSLILTNYKRLQKAIEKKAINAIVIKPNQNGSLIEVAEIVKLAKENNIKVIFSHRSGETMENILSDLAFGFGADFLKCGITGDVRETKIKRLIEIEKSLSK
ncbi:MAG: hypothetical protein PF542_01685 [Nanoarchaeota archaeon]|jgi:enolase|nr:hypothetical protein [Nanoarchaeota archaeon]